MCGRLAVKAKQPSDVAKAGVGLAAGDSHSPQTHPNDDKLVDANQAARCPRLRHYCVLSNLLVEIKDNAINKVST